MQDNNLSLSINEEQDPLFWHYEREKRLNIKGTFQWTNIINSQDGKSRFEIRSNFDFISNSCYVDVLIPSKTNVELVQGIFKFILDNIENLATSSPIESQFPLKHEGFLIFDKFPDQKLSTRTCRFTGRIFVYTHYTISPEDKKFICDVFAEKSLSILIRDHSWIIESQKFMNSPLIFLGHDSSDKDDLVRELALKIDGNDARVWYDEISLRPGDRLRKSLDSGLEKADYFVPVITENWISNTRYAEYEFDSVMQKYITEKSVVIIPVCVGISPSRLKDKSRVLADIIAIVHKKEDSIDSLASKILNAVDPKIPAIGTPLPAISEQGKVGFFSVGFTIGPNG
jgi:hypothetical protein